MEEDHQIVGKDGNQSSLQEQTVLKFMKLAIKEAEKAFNQVQVPVGCVFVKKINQSYQVIEESHNMTNHDKNASNHCEINCLKRMELKMTSQQISQCILFVTVEPCIMCTHALNCMGIKHVYFGQFNDRFGGCGSVLQSNNFSYKGGILQNESWDIIRKFYERGNQRLPEQLRNRSRKSNKINE